MEPTNQPFRKENDLPNLQGIMFHVNLQGFKFPSRARRPEPPRQVRAPAGFVMFFGKGLWVHDGEINIHAWWISTNPFKLGIFPQVSGWTYYSNWIIPPILRGENSKTYLKTPPPRYAWWIWWPCYRTPKTTVYLMGNWCMFHTLRIHVWYIYLHLP